MIIANSTGIIMGVHALLVLYYYTTYTRCSNHKFFVVTAPGPDLVNKQL